MATPHTQAGCQTHSHVVVAPTESKIWRFTGGVRPSWFGPTLAAAAALAVCLTVALRDPREEGSFAVCPWLYLTGTQCPGCGTLRSLNRLVGGDLVGALGYNVMSVVAVPILAYAWFRWALPANISRRLPWFMTKTHQLRGVWALAAVLLAFGVVRNLPWEPFTWLLPTG